MRAVAVLLCAGRSERMGFDKLTAPIAGKTAIERSLDALLKGGVEAVVFVTNAEHETYLHQLSCPVPSIVVMGGEVRMQSVGNALHADLWQNDDIAVIHDAARCMVSSELVRASIEGAKAHGSGVVALRVSDTMLKLEQNGDLWSCLGAVDRDSLYRMQTPQSFRYSAIKRAHELAGELMTDDASLYARYTGLPLHLVRGSVENIKLTDADDWRRLERELSCTKYGTGYDTHRLVDGRKLILGGVEIPFDKGLFGHSDADVLLHAICDALLGACALGDIGQAFPDNDPAYKGIDSRILLRRVADMVQKRGMAITNIDSTIIAQRPKLLPYEAMMRMNIAQDCGIPMENVSVKATTTEGMNDEGKGLCISAQAVAALKYL